jgi:hypothetical protein
VRNSLLLSSREKFITFLSFHSQFSHNIPANLRTIPNLHPQTPSLPQLFSNYLFVLFRPTHASSSLTRSFLFLMNINVSRGKSSFCSAHGSAYVYRETRAMKNNMNMIAFDARDERGAFKRIFLLFVNRFFFLLYCSCLCSD